MRFGAVCLVIILLGSADMNYNIVEFVTEEVENAEPSSGFHANVNTIEVVADVHRSESGSVVDMLVNFDSPSKELTVSNTSVLNTSNE
jgi:hypothetical protein